jgi:predicted DNA binding protein
LFPYLSGDFYVRGDPHGDVRRVTFRARYPVEVAHPIQRRIMESGPVSRAELLMWGPMSDVTTLTWFDGGPDAVEGVLAAVGSATTSHLVADDGGTYAFVHQTGFELIGSVLERVAESSVVYLPPVVFLDTGEVRFEAVGESGHLSAFHDELNDVIDVTIESVHGFRREPSPGAVTDRQRAALEAGAAVGYYEVPRSGSVADVAAELDCSTSTAGELLRRGEAALVAAYTEGGELI